MGLENKPILLALSGGGIRAMVFHLGLFRFLADKQLLERVQHLSTVSGGSLLVGLMLQECGLRWPTSNDFSHRLYPSLRLKLCQRSLQWGALRQVFRNGGWRFLLSRANLLGAAIREEWGVTGRISDLPTRPEWAINGTTAETGRRFRFNRINMGDYKIGYADSGEFAISDAMAVSAAFPGGFGPLAIDPAEYVWRKYDPDARRVSDTVLDMPYRRLHLYDGGVYDNLGLEPFLGVDGLKDKHRNGFLIVSDAGAPLPENFRPGALNPFRLKHVADIMSDQTRALRVRILMKYLSEPGRGMYIWIGTVDRSRSRDTEIALRYPTTLRKVTAEDFDLISEHGYRTAENVFRNQNERNSVAPSAASL